MNHAIHDCSPFVPVPPMKNQKPRCGIVYVLVSLILGMTSVTAVAQEKNVLIFYIDDLRPELGCYGVDAIKSPNIDALATAGVVFNRAYCQQALCGPSRISMMSGQYPSTTGIMDLWTPLTKAVPDAMSLPRYFKERKYVTYSFGKVYHHTRDDQKSWDTIKPKPESVYANRQTLRAIKQREEEGKKNGVSPEELRILSKGPAIEMADVKDEAYPDGKIAQQAIEALQQNSNKPFFMCVGLTKPHLPFAAPKRYWDLYDREQFSVPERSLPTDAPSLAFTIWGELRAYAGIPSTGNLSDAQTKELKHGYAASISFTDAQVGKVLAEVDRLGLRDNTIIVLWGDHGYKLGEYGAWCKHTNLELDTHVPFIVSAPGFAPGKRSNALVEMIDIFPTLAQLTGGDIPESCEGKSIRPVLENPEMPFRPFALSMYPRGKTVGYSLRTDRWRYTEWINSETKQIMFRELYDHQDSPIAMENLAQRPEHQELVSRLSTQVKSVGQ